jgi:hypothetical protein
VLDGLGYGVEGEGLPSRYRYQRLVEPVRGVDGVHDLGWGSPALGGALLEQAEAVAVAVRLVDQAGLLRGGRDRDYGGPLRELHGGPHVVDDSGVVDLADGQAHPVDRYACLDGRGVAGGGDLRSRGRRGS